MKKELFVKTSYVCVGLFCTYTYTYKLQTTYVAQLGNVAFRVHQTALYHSLNRQSSPHITIFCVYIISLLSSLR